MIHDSKCDWEDEEEEEEVRVKKNKILFFYFRQEVKVIAMLECE